MNVILEPVEWVVSAVRGKRSWSSRQTPVFGLLQREGKVYVDIVNGSRERLLPVIQGNILARSRIHTDGWKAYEGLILNGYDHYRVCHSKNEFARGKGHVNGIESFWSFVKRRLAQFNGTRKLSICISKKVNTDLIIDAKMGMLYSSWH